MTSRAAGGRGAPLHGSGTEGRGAGQADLLGRQGLRTSRARATGFSPSRSPPATSSSSAGLNSTERRLRGRAQARLLSLAGIPDRPPAVRRDDQSRHRRADGRGARSSSASTWPTCAGSSPTRRSATAASAVSPPASWTAWRRSRSPRMATASATTTACSARSSATAGSRRCRRTGSPTAIPGSSSGPSPITPIGFGGSVEVIQGDDERARHVWHPAETVEAVAYDTPIVGWRGKHVNTLRLWSARALDPIKLDAFNAGDYIGALAETVRAEAISKVLYPSDATPAGQELRLRQEYFFASASLQDIVRRHVKQYGDVRTLADHAAIQLNDTHPAIAVAELMRILVDLNELDMGRGLGDHAGRPSPTPTTRCCPRRWRRWPVPLLERLLPRHMQIIYAINAGASRRRAPARLRRSGPPGVDLADRRARRPAGAHGQSRLRRLAQGQRRVGAAHRPDEQDGVPRPQRVYPDRINNKTNGITLPPLADRVQSAASPSIIRRRLGERALDDAERADGPRRATPTTPPFQEQRRRGASAPTRSRSRASSPSSVNQRVDPDALFDVQVKRIHEYKRQLLNILETVALYNAIRANPTHRLGAAGQDLRRQGGAELHAGQADHQAGQRRRAASSTPTRPCAACSRSSSCPTTTSRWPRRSFRPPTSPSRSRPPAWRRRAPAT